MKPQASERLGVAIEELERLPAHDAVDRGHALLAVEEQLDHTGGERPVAAMRGGLGLRGPHEQAAHGAAQVERGEELADLVAVPDEAALEFRKGHVTAVDVVEDGGDLHTRRILPVRSSCIMPCWRARAFVGPVSKVAVSASRSAEHFWARNRDAQSFEGAGKITEAIELYEMNISDGFTGAFPYDRLRVLYTQGKDYANAIRICELAIKNRIPFPMTYLARLRNLAQGG
jgi:hypothetical protein